LLQITLTTPFRLMMRQCSHMGFTDGLTFMPVTLLAKNIDPYQPR